MKRRRAKSLQRVSDAQKERDRTLRSKYSNKPTPADLQASGEFTPMMKHGEYLALMDFANSLREIRELKKLSLADLSESTGIDKAAISRLENGLTENPTLATLERLARSIGKRIRIELEDDCRV